MDENEKIEKNLQQTMIEEQVKSEECDDLVELIPESSDYKIQKNSSKKNSDIKKSGLLYKLGSVSDKTISLLATIAMFILIAAPGIMSIIDMFKKNIDYTLLVYLDMIQIWAFPMVSVIVFFVYILVLLRIRNSRVGLARVVKNNPIFVIFSLAILLIVISQLYNGMEFAAHAFYVTTIGESFDMEITYFVFILFGATQVRKESHKHFLLRAQAFASVIVIIAAFILWHTQKSNWFSDWDARGANLMFCGIFTNVNYLGYYLSFSVPITAAAFVYEKKMIWKIIEGCSFIFVTIGLSINACRGAIIGAAVAIVFIIIAHLIIEKRVNWQTLILVPAFAVIILLGGFNSRVSLGSEIASLIEGDEQAGSGRLLLWKESVKIINDNKLLGIGFEGIVEKQLPMLQYNARPHNEFLQYALFHGIPMALMYIVGCVAIFIRALRKRKIMDGATLVSLAGALGYLTSSFFGLTIFATAMYVFVFMGMGYVRDPLDNIGSTDKTDSYVM